MCHLIGVWRWLVVIAVLDFMATAILMIYVGANIVMIPIVMFAYTSGAATIGALAFWARDRWLKQSGILRQ